jgi:LPS-assembly lipoprotein
MALSACAGPLGEFTPLYASKAGAPLSRVETRTGDGRASYLLRERLDDALARERGEQPLYRLNLAVAERRVPRGLRIDNVANRYELTMQAGFDLIDLQSRRVMTRGSVTSTVTYDSADQAFASVSAHQDAQVRAAADIAQKLRVRLAAYFVDPKPLDPTAPTTEVDSAVLGGRLSPQSIPSPGERATRSPDAGLAAPEPGVN